mmetsp:Transcript_133917/g.267255  ORF Transcript_133917/g.267255 Transcript_133917/m.267255 type:complete len:300 (+) Transcript_133917:337-1236(+)
MIPLVFSLSSCLMQFLVFFVRGFVEFYEFLQSLFVALNFCNLVVDSFLGILCCKLVFVACGLDSMLLCRIPGIGHAAARLSFRRSALTVERVFYNATAPMLAALACRAIAAPASTVLVIFVVRSRPPHERLILLPAYEMHLFGSSLEGCVLLVHFGLCSLCFLERCHSFSSCLHEFFLQHVGYRLFLFVNCCLAFGFVPEGLGFFPQFRCHVPCLLNITLFKTRRSRAHGKILRVLDACTATLAACLACKVRATTLREGLAAFPIVILLLLFVTFIFPFGGLLFAQFCQHTCILRKRCV